MGKRCVVIMAINIRKKLLALAISDAMESFGTEFPGFQILAPRDEFATARKPPLSRLQKRAPLPLQLQPASAECRSEVKLIGGTSPKGTYFASNDPIPLLSPLVLPSVLESPVIIQKESLAKSH